MFVKGFDFRENLRYYSGNHIHLWLKEEGETVLIGIDSITQKSSKGITFVFLKEKEGSEVRKGQLLGTLETNKLVLRIEAPISGKILKINEKIDEDAHAINEDPYGDGWIFKILPTNKSEMNSLYFGEKGREWFEAEAEKYSH